RPGAGSAGSRALARAPRCRARPSCQFPAPPAPPAASEPRPFRPPTSCIYLAPMEGSGWVDEPSFRGAKRTRNLEILRCAIAHHSSTLRVARNDVRNAPAAADLRSFQRRLNRSQITPIFPGDRTASRPAGCMGRRKGPSKSLREDFVMSRVPSLSSPFLLGFDEIERALDRVVKGADGYPPYNIERCDRANGQPERLRITLAVAGFTRD